MTKKCCTCGNIKPLSEFHRRGDKLQGNCKSCKKEYIRKHYQANKEKYVKSSVESMRKTREWFRDYKSNLKCSKCSETHPACLDFHHIDPSEKDMEVSRIIDMNNKKRIMDEVAKCVVLCSNCHRKLHYQNKEIAKSLNIAI